MTKTTQKFENNTKKGGKTDKMRSDRKSIVIIFLGSFHAIWVYIGGVMRIKKWVSISLFGILCLAMLGFYERHFLPKPPSSSAFAVTEHKPFVIIIPSYNNSEWVEKNLRSVFEQKYDNYRVIYIDDASQDSTLAQVEEFVHRSKQSHRVQILHNETNQGAMHNIYKGVSGCEPHEVVFVLDGDDWLPHDRVICRLNEYYANPQVWVTWGSYIEYPSYKIQHVANFSRSIPQKVIDHHQVRQYAKEHWSFSQLRTFYAGLFHKIALQDLHFEGHFVDAACDVALFIPLMEMAGSHVQFIPEVLYIWNRATPLNDDKVRAKRQKQIAQQIYKKPPYAPLPALFDSPPKIVSSP